MKIVIIPAFICLLFLSGCGNSKADKQLSDSDVDGEMSGDADVLVYEENEDADVPVMACDEKEIKIPVKKDAIDVKFFPGEADDFYRMDVAGQTVTLYHYSEAMDLITEFSGTVPEDQPDYMNPVAPDKIMYVQSDYSKVNHVIGFIKKSGNIEIKINANITVPTFYNNEMVVMVGNEISYYDENLQFLRNETKEQLTYDYTGSILKFCNDRIFLLNWSSSGATMSVVWEGDPKSFVISGRECINYEDDIYMDCEGSFTAFHCDESGATALFNFKKIPFNDSDPESDGSQIIKLTTDARQIVERFGPSAYDAKLSDDSTFKSIFVDYISGSSFYNTILFVNELNGKIKTFQIPFYHTIDPTDSFINGSGNYFMIDKALNPYVAIFKPDGTLIAEKVFSPVKQVHFQVEDFATTGKNDDFVFTGGISFPIDESENAGLVDNFTGRISYQTENYTLKTSGTIRDETGKFIEKTDSGYVSTSLSYEKLGVYSGNQTYKSTVDLKLSFLNNDLEETKAVTLENPEPAIHILKSYGNYVDLLRVSDKVYFNRYDLSGVEKIAKSWSLSSIHYIKKINSFASSADGSKVVFSYTYNYIRTDTNQDYENTIFYVVKLSSDSKTGLAASFGDYSGFKRFGDFLLDNDGKIYTAFTAVDASSQRQSSPSLIFGYINDSMDFIKTIEVQKHELCYVKGDSKTGNFYILFDDKMTVYSKNGKQLSKADMRVSTPVHVDDSGSITSISSSYSDDGTSIIIKKRECGF